MGRCVYVFDTGSVDETWRLFGQLPQRETRCAVEKGRGFFSETRCALDVPSDTKAYAGGDWFCALMPTSSPHTTSGVREEPNAEHETVVITSIMISTAPIRGGEIGSRKELMEDAASDCGAPPMSFRAATANLALPLSETMQWRDGFVSLQCRFCGARATAHPHYPYRDPLQLQRRCRIRAVMMATKRTGLTGTTRITSLAESDWKKWISPTIG